MTAKWNPKLHPRDGENGRFVHNWERRLAEQIDAAVRRGDVSRRYAPTTERPLSAPPIAAQRGFVRIGDRPDRQGAADGARSGTITPSTHPLAGGVWIDPDRPGTNHAPRFLNDNGHRLADLQPAPSKSERHKIEVQSRRTEDWTGTPEGRERLPTRDGGKIGRRLEGAPAAAVKEMRRAQARARVEGSSRTPKRRTPRGTQVEGWMSRVNERIEKGTRRG
jgi:hypothetical protein